MATQVINAQVSRKFKNQAKKTWEGDDWVGHRHAEGLQHIIPTVYDLIEKEQKKKKLSKEDLELKQRITDLLPAILQLEDDCLYFVDKEMYFNTVKKIILTEQKKALKGDKVAKREYNRLVSHWKQYEPGKFPLIKQ